VSMSEDKEPKRYITVESDMVLSRRALTPNLQCIISLVPQE
jgi:hypothetical protein